MLAITSINFNQKSYTKNNCNNSIRPMPKDIFTLRQKSNIPFCSVPRKKMATLYNNILNQIKQANSEESVNKVFDIFTAKYNELRSKSCAEYVHEMNNVTNLYMSLLADTKRFLKDSFYPHIQNDKECLAFKKDTFAKLLDTIDECTNRWSIIEKWDKPSTIAPFQDVFDLLKKMPSKSQYKNISLDGLGLLQDKKIKNPAQFYTCVSQPLGNAIKYGEDKPFKIKIEEVVKAGQKSYYASFINPDTKTIPDKEIDKILEGYFYRASNATKANINGSGAGFYNIVRILTFNGYKSDIPNLIEKGRKKGVHVRIPLIGVCE